MANKSTTTLEDMWRIQTALANTNFYHDHAGASVDELTRKSYDNCAIHIRKKLLGSAYLWDVKKKKVQTLK